MNNGGIGGFGRPVVPVTGQQSRGPQDGSKSGVVAGQAAAGSSSLDKNSFSRQAATQESKWGRFKADSGLKIPKKDQTQTKGAKKG